MGHIDHLVRLRASATSGDWTPLEEVGMFQPRVAVGNPATMYSHSEQWVAEFLPGEQGIADAKYVAASRAAMETLLQIAQAVLYGQHDLANDLARELDGETTPEVLPLP